ncbi:uncharacterized protein LOC130629062 [Hydractinia symbiolongicarpus]|uniref:uncharacterized protein LOC130629062 n=1 Tax=Hydractinia symbiolongicarpus TaxID=13093 RepID=UPI00254BF3BA|nr:uncharacterized protein LOC130629062 [Hydractinia symbiolongicarpus]
MLATEINTKVVHMVRSMRSAGAVINFHTIVGLATCIVIANEKIVLKENGSSVKFTIKGCQSIFKRLNAVRRKSTSLKPLKAPGLIEIRFSFYKKINDQTVKSKNGSISVSVYRKPTHNDQYLNFESNHQKSCKESVISSLLNRANSVVSEKQERKEEFRHVRNALIANGYSQKVITQVENKMKRRCNGDNKKTSEEFIASPTLRTRYQRDPSSSFKTTHLPKRRLLNYHVQEMINFPQ